MLGHTLESDNDRIRERKRRVDSDYHMIDQWVAKALRHFDSPRRHQPKTREVAFLILAKTTPRARPSLFQTLLDIANVSGCKVQIAVLSRTDRYRRYGRRTCRTSQ